MSTQEELSERFRRKRRLAWWQGFATGTAVTVVVIALLASTGCATIERHPKLVAAGVIVIGTSLALSLHKGSTVEPEPKKSDPLICPPEICRP